jgi:hypothetical protein
MPVASEIRREDLRHREHDLRREVEGARLVGPLRRAMRRIGQVTGR